MTPIPRDQWYVAAYSSEIGQDLFARTICGEPILFWRTRDGRVTRMADRCVHRRFPLSQPPSRLVDDTVVCGYHGFTYDATGACVAVPGQTRIPRTARVRVVPGGGAGLVRVGVDRRPGDGRRASIPRAPWLAAGLHDRARHGAARRAATRCWSTTCWTCRTRRTCTAATSARRRSPTTPITTEVDDDAGIVRVSRHMDDAECPPFYAKSTGIQGRIARWQDIEYTPPCLYLLHSRIAPGRLRCPPGRHRSGRVPRRDRVRDHPGDRALDARLLGRGKGLRPRRRGGVGVPAPRATARSCCRTSRP